jgi:hypothetical protein
MTVNLDLAGAPFVESSDAANERRFARSIWTCHTHNAAWRHVKRDAPKYGIALFSVVFLEPCA